MVTSISANASKGNSSLKSLDIGSCVESIGNRAFYKCKNLKSITVRSGIISKVGKGALSGLPKKAVTKVPSDCRLLYQNLFKNAGYPSSGNVK